MRNKEGGVKNTGIVLVRILVRIFLAFQMRTPR